MQKDCQARKLNSEKAMEWIVVYGGSWKRMIDDQDRCELVNVSSGTGSLG